MHSASLRGDATKDGLATIQGTGLTLGRSGNTELEAFARGVRVTVAGRLVPVFSFNDSKINIYIPDSIGTGVQSVVVYVNGSVTATDDIMVANDNPGIFTVGQDGAGEAIALQTSALLHTRSPFAAKTNGQPTVIALFGTGWRNSLPVTVTVGGKQAVVEYAGPSGGFYGLDQINVRIPDAVSGQATVIVICASIAVSQGDVMISIDSSLNNISIHELKWGL